MKNMRGTLWLLLSLLAALALLTACAPVPAGPAQPAAAEPETAAPEPVAEGAKIILRVGTGDTAPRSVSRGSCRTATGSR